MLGNRKITSMKRGIEMKHFFDYSEGDFGIELSRDLLIDAKGNLMQRMGDSMAMDLDSGELHIISSDTSDDEE